MITLKQQVEELKEQRNLTVLKVSRIECSRTSRN